ncbi:MAG: DUF445 domain-containing protein [Sulfurospirillaceae bacterium]|nr:DUF445 domain-containing protein [Sulfurospirillaceae bacterium]
MKIDKSWLTDIVSITVVFFSFVLAEPYAHWFLLAGLFALSGALTNQIAIHMLFEKVPFLYGSGVIQLRFEAFKSSIKNLIINQFFTKSQLDNFFAQEEKKIDLTQMIDELDFSVAFDALGKTVMESSIGGMLSMFGGVGVLEALREPFGVRLKQAMTEMTKSNDFNNKLNQKLKDSSLSSDILSTLEQLIDKRLDELTPQMVKEIVQNFIKEHLGWLVVWGGFFGGIMGLLSAVIL